MQIILVHFSNAWMKSAGFMHCSCAVFLHCVVDIVDSAFYCATARSDRHLVFIVVVRCGALGTADAGGDPLP